jgi:hypothetical protein
MKKLKNKILNIAAASALMLGASTGFAQETKDTLKIGETTHDMVIKPEPPKDSMVVNPWKGWRYYGFTE